MKTNALYSQQDALLSYAKRFFGFDEQSGIITIVLPRITRTRKASLVCKNYPLFPYEMPPDDVFTALRVYPMLVSLYGNRVQVELSEELRAKPSGHCVLIGSPVTNPFTNPVLKNQYYRFGRKEKKEDCHDIFVRDGESYSVLLDGDDNIPLQARRIVRDYALIAKCSRQGRIDIVLAGCRAYGQLVLWSILKDADFYERVLSKITGKDFQILLQVDVEGHTCTEWEILDVRS